MRTLAYPKIDIGSNFKKFLLVKIKINVARSLFVFVIGFFFFLNLYNKIKINK